VWPRVVTPRPARVRERQDDLDCLGKVFVAQAACTRRVRMRETLLCLLFAVSVAGESAAAAERYSVMGLVHPAVDWDCAGFFCDETTAVALLLGFGETLRDTGLFYRGDAFFTLGKGE